MSRRKAGNDNLVATQSRRVAASAGNDIFSTTQSTLVLSLSLSLFLHWLYAVTLQRISVSFRLQTIPFSCCCCCCLFFHIFFSLHFFVILFCFFLFLLFCCQPLWRTCVCSRQRGPARADRQFMQGTGGESSWGRRASSVESLKWEMAPGYARLGKHCVPRWAFNCCCWPKCTRES